MLWTEKFNPKNLEEFIGNTDLVQKALVWSKEWNSGKIQKPLLFFGQTGSGKTTLAYLLAKINSWSVFELNASDFRNKDSIEKIAGSAAMNSSFTGEKRLILFDEIDALSSADRGGGTAINKILKESQNPVILTANKVYGEKKLMTIRNNCALMKFKKINYLSMSKRLKELCVTEGIEVEEEAIELLAKNSAGDMRSALIDLHTLALTKKVSLKDIESLGYREKQEDVFKVLRKIFTAETFSEARNARFSADIDSDLLMKWIEENIPRQFSDINEIANAFEKLSKADVFNGRIRRRQHYGFLRYSSELMSTGVSMSKEKPNRNFIMYQFPVFISRLNRNSSLRETKKSIASKMSNEIHSSTKEIIASDLPFIKQCFSNKDFAVRFSAKFELTEKEIAFLLNTKPETKKVKVIFDEAKTINFFGAARKPLEGINGSFFEKTKEKQSEEKTEEVKQETQSSLKNYFS